MSAGYAERLKEYPDKGICGLPERYDSPKTLASKLDRLARLMRRSRRTVFLTGAGISTSAGIPDFRGPDGIWTREQREEKRKERNRKRRKKGGGKSSTPRNGRKRQRSEAEEDAVATNGEGEEGRSKPRISFETAMPTYTHRALTHLILHPPPRKCANRNGDNNIGNRNNRSEIDGNDNNNDNHNDNDNDKDNDTSDENDDTDDPPRTYLHHVVTQNVDGLHRKSLLPRSKFSILHGDIFTELCPVCSAEHVRSSEVRSIGLRPTGRICGLGGCSGMLQDTLLDWEDDLPRKEWSRAEEECARAELVVCLGTSLRIEPAAGLCEYPELWPWPWDAVDRGNGEEEAEKEEKEEENSGAAVVGEEEGKTRKRKDGRETLGFAVVNLQKTPYDEDAALVVRAKADDVMRELMDRLGYGQDWDAIVIDDDDD